MKPSYDNREELLRVVEDSLPASIAVLDAKGYIVGVNEAWKRFARENGDPNLEHTCIGQNYLDVCRRAEGESVEDAKEALEGLQAILDGSKSGFELVYHFPYPYADQWYAMRAAPLQGGEGGAVVFHVDISDLKKAEDELRASEALLRQFVEHAPVAVEMFDTEMRYLLVSQRFKKQFGFEDQDIIGKSHYEVFPESAKWKDVHQRCMTGAVERREEDLLERADGTKDWLRWEVQPWRDKDGKIGGLIIFAEVITERKLAEEERAHAKQLSDALNTVNATIGATLDFDEIMRRVVVEAAGAIGCESTIVAIRENEKWKPEHIHGDMQELLEAELTDEDFPYASLAAQTRGPVVDQDVYDGKQKISRFVFDICIGSILVLPLIVKEEVLGVLAFVYRSHAVPFTEAQIDFARKLGSSVSLALENARLYEAEKTAVEREAQARQAVQRQFETLQRALVPAKPTICRGYNVAAIYVPGSAGLEIGGDFYDVFATETGKVGLLIGDVSGKDVEAAALAAAARSIVRAFAYEMPSAGQALTHANAVLCAQQQESRLFATLVLVILDPQTGGISYSNAGHPPAAVIRRDGQVDLLAFGHPPMGVVETLCYPEKTDHLEPGEKIALYTDGITEARHGLEMFDTLGVVRTLSEHGKGSPDEVAKQLLTAAKDWSRGRLADDIAMVVVERTA